MKHKKNPIISIKTIDSLVTQSTVLKKTVITNNNYLNILLWQHLPRNSSALSVFHRSLKNKGNLSFIWNILLLLACHIEANEDSQNKKITSCLHSLLYSKLETRVKLSMNSQMPAEIQLTVITTIPATTQPSQTWICFLKLLRLSWINSRNTILSAWSTAKAKSESPNSKHSWRMLAKTTNKSVSYWTLVHAHSARVS